MECVSSFIFGHLHAPEKTQRPLDRILDVLQSQTLQSPACSLSTTFLCRLDKRREASTRNCGYCSEMKFPPLSRMGFLHFSKQFVIKWLRCRGNNLVLQAYRLFTVPDSKRVFSKQKPLQYPLSDTSLLSKRIIALPFSSELQLPVQTLAYSDRPVFFNRWETEYHLMVGRRLSRGKGNCLGNKVFYALILKILRV